MSDEFGTISKWNDEKGFGFITPEIGTGKIFVHISNFSKDHKRPVEGLNVSYRTSKDSRGKSYATEVMPIRGHRKVTKADKQLFFSVIVSTIFFATITSLVAISQIPLFILVAYFFLSAAAFGLYKKDKSAAQWDEWRTPESTLHFISLIGGWPGALLAQNKLRHKSNKISFRVVYWLTVVVNCGALTWLATPDGAATLQGFIHLLYRG